MFSADGEWSQVEALKKYRTAAPFVRDVIRES
jgi:hypothetical protein